MKKAIAFLLILSCCVAFSGCWNYWGLDEMDIVTGMAIDRPDPEGPYHITVELVNTHSTSENGATDVEYIEAIGETSFNALRNAKRSLADKFYGGNMQTLIISHQIAETEGVFYIIEEVLRDAEPRETLTVLISQEETAKEILFTESVDTNIVSYELHESVREDHMNTASTKEEPLYKVYSDIKGKGKSLVLPAVHCRETVSGKKGLSAETNGIAVFQKDRLKGYLSPEDSMYYLFIKDEILNTAYSVPMEGETNKKISMEIRDNKSKTKVSFEDGQVKVKVAIKSQMNVIELNGYANLSLPKERDRLEDKVETYLEDSLKKVFQKVQKEIGFDIFGLGNLLYKKDPKTWDKIDQDWDTLFQNAVLDVEAEVIISNTGVLKDY